MRTLITPPKFTDGIPWSPLELPNLLAWYDASDASTFTYSSGSLVSEWRDKSGNGFHLSQGTVANQPTRVELPDGKAKVLFGLTDQLSCLMQRLTSSVRFTTFVVSRMLTSPGGHNKTFDFGDSGGGFGYSYRAPDPGNKIAILNHSPAEWITGAVTTTPGPWHIIDFMRDSSAMGIRLNGVDQGVYYTTHFNAATNNPTNFIVHPDSFEEEVGVIIVCDGDLSSIDRLTTYENLKGFWMPVAEDTFSRVDSTTLGSTEVGGMAWTEHVGNMEIVSNGVSCVTGTNASVATFDCGRSDYELIQRIRTSPTTDRTALTVVFRFVDMSNRMWLNVYKFSGTNAFILGKTVSGVDTEISRISSAGFLDDTEYEVKVICRGSLIQCFIDGVLKLSTVQTDNVSNTRVGISGYASPPNDDGNSRFEFVTVKY